MLDSDKAKATFDLLKKIPAGIGKHFWSFVGMILLAIAIIAASGTMTFKLGMHFIGNLGLDPATIKGVMASQMDMKQFLDSLTFEQLIKLNNWNMLIISITSLLSFLFMLWIPEIIYKSRNPFMAIFRSVKKVFSRPWKAIKLFIYTSLLNFILSFINTFSFVNPVIYFIMMLIYFYFLVYLVVLLFLYYDREFVE